jgi:hypothetical protein
VSDRRERTGPSDFGSNPFRPAFARSGRDEQSGLRMDLSPTRHSPRSERSERAGRSCSGSNPFRPVRDSNVVRIAEEASGERSEPRAYFEAQSGLTSTRPVLPIHRRSPTSGMARAVEGASRYPRRDRANLCEGRGAERGSERERDPNAVRVTEM